MTNLPSRPNKTDGSEVIADDFLPAAVIADESSPSVNELAVLAKSGCAVAFASLYERLQPRLLNFIETRLARADIQAEDVAQETFTKAWRSIHSFDARYQFVTWIYTIAARTATDHVLKARRTRHHPLEMDVPARCKSHESSLEDSEALDNLWAIAAKHLSDDQYAALWLRYGEDLSVREIARIMDKTRVGVRVLLHRGRNTLQQRSQTPKSSTRYGVSIAKVDTNSERKSARS